MSPGTLEKPPVAGGIFSEDKKINALIEQTEADDAISAAMELLNTALETDEDGDYERLWWFMKGYKKKLGFDYEFHGELEVLERIEHLEPEYKEELEKHRRRRGIKGKK